MAHTPLLRLLRAHLLNARRQRVDRGERRTVLAGLGAVGVIAATPALSGCRDKGGDSGVARTGSRVAVVGGGIAGLHCAWRLLEAGSDVTLYEAQERVGGRMWTGRGVFPDGLIYEIGGELIDSNHATMWALAEELGIALDDRWASEEAGMLRETSWVNGALVSNETLLEQLVAVADLFAAQVEAADSDDAAFETLDNTTLKDWLDDNVPAGTYPELHAVLAAAYLGEFGLENDEQSCLNLLYLFGYDSTDEFLIFGDSDERWHTHLGNDTFTTALWELLGDTVQLDHALIRVEDGEDGTFLLTFSTGSGEVQVQVDHVVFALPFTLLREVDLDDLTLSAEKRQIINELGYGTNAKVMGGFSRRPWWDDHNQSGLLTSDLGVQQGWDSTIGQDSKGGGVWTNFLGGAQGLASEAGTADEWFRAILGDLETIWPGSSDAYTGQAERMHWPSWAFSKGSYTCYRPGQWAFWSLEGVREGNVHFCGEHCSLDFQGWMEGAAETGGLVAAEVLDDLGLARSAAHERVLREKLLRPQSCYHGDRNPRLSPLRRRRS
jgi:monoamine oxidase